MKICCWKKSQHTFLLMKTSWRRLSSSSAEDVFKTPWSKRIFSLWPYFFKTSSRRFQDAFPRSRQDVFKTCSRRLGKMLSRHLQDVFKTSSRHLQEVLQRCRQTVLVNKPWRRIQHVSILFETFQYLTALSWQLFSQKGSITDA